MDFILLLDLPEVNGLLNSVSLFVLQRKAFPRPDNHVPQWHAQVGLSAVKKQVQYSKTLSGQQSLDKIPQSDTWLCAELLFCQGHSDMVRGAFMVTEQNPWLLDLLGPML